MIVSLLFIVVLWGARRSQAEPGVAASANPTGQVSEQEFHFVPAGLSPLELKHGFVTAGSVKVFVDGALWVPERDYRVRTRSGLVVPRRSWVAAAGDSTAVSSRALVSVQYDFIPVPVPGRRDLRPVAPPPGRADAGASSGLFRAASSNLGERQGDLFVRGSKTVQVSSGSRREMTVDQNLRLTIAGQLTPEIAVRAFLTDDNLPVVPEGNTEQLRDIDKVLVELKAPHWQATLGDFVARRDGTTFGNYRRKLQGMSLRADPGRTKFEVLAGSPRGRYRTLQVRGQESNQGPYFLGGGGTSGNLFIVAGSERVTVDGRLLTRGAERDYVIDYVAGTITFTFRQLITAETTIVVEFEEGEGAYARTVVGAGASVALQPGWLASPVTVSARITREKDDAGRLRTGTLGPDDEAILRGAGDQPGLAVAGGVRETPPGEGEYDRQVVAGQTIYVFNAEGGDFDLDLFYVGPGAGDYQLQELTTGGQRVFSYAGTGLGSYLIGRPIPLPSAQSVATIASAVGDTAASYLRAEWNASREDLNQLSDLDGADDAGQAGRVSGRWRNEALALGGRSLGALDLSGAWENSDGSFRPFQVRKTIFDYADWGLDDRARRENFLSESERESQLAATWRLGAGSRSLALSGGLGRLRHGVALTAARTSGQAEWRVGGGRGLHQWQEARADDRSDPLAIRRSQRRHSVGWELGPVEPRLKYRRQRWRDDQVSGERAGGYQLEEFGGGLASRPGEALAWHVDFVRGLADSLVGGVWRLERDSRTTTGGATTGRLAGMRLVGEGTLRQVKRPGGADEATRLARVNLAGKWDRAFSDWSLGYRVDNSRSEVLNRQLVFAGEGQGDFNVDGVYVGEEQGEYDLVVAGTDSLVATTGVLADLNWRQGFDFLGPRRWYGAWSAMTLASFEARSKTDEVGRLLRLDPSLVFERESAVLGDLNFSEELVFLRHVRGIDLRSRYAYRETVDRQYAGRPEDRSNRTWQVTGNVSVTRRNAVKLRWQREDDRRYTVENSLGARGSLVMLVRRYELGWNYSPHTNLRLGLQGEYLTRRDDISLVAQREYAVKPTGRARLRKAWTLQGDLRVAKVSSDEAAGSARPYFFPDPGTNIENSLRLAWEPSSLLSVSASWFARKRGQRRWQHDVRLETTARF